MKERPIIFSGPMVTSILEGRKTQTRRVVKPQPYSNGYRFAGGDILCHNDYLPPDAMLLDVRRRHSYTISNYEGWESACPFGQPGDRLWVRESHYRYTGLPVGDRAPSDFVHAPSGDPYQARAYDDANGLDCYLATASALRVPSIHMPRWASRLTIEVVGVRVERLQDITDADIRAEGFGEDYDDWRDGVANVAPPGSTFEALREYFAARWNGINYKRGHPWENNPWVWIIEFKAIA